MQHGRYTIAACTRECWYPTKQKRFNKKRGVWEDVKKPSYFRYIWFQAGSYVWAFVGTARKSTVNDNGDKVRSWGYSDTRDKAFELGSKPKRLTEQSLRVELERLTSPETADDIFYAMETVTLTSEEYADVIGADYVEVPMTDGTTTMQIKGGLPAKVLQAITSTKGRVELDKIMYSR